MEPRHGWIPEWPKGTDCKSAANCFGGSNPPPSISMARCPIRTGRRVEKRRHGGIGRRKGLKIPRGQPRTGSSPVAGSKTSGSQRFFFWAKKLKASYTLFRELLFNVFRQSCRAKLSDRFARFFQIQKFPNSSFAFVIRSTTGTLKGQRVSQPPQAMHSAALAERAS